MRTALFIFLLAILLLPAHQSFAEDGSYYIEVGSDVSEDAAANQWKDLSTKYKRQLGSLQYFPKTVIEDGKVTGVRLQAGPIPTKNKAQRVCSHLFAHKVPCFVLEGMENAPPSTVTSLTDKIRQEAAAEAPLPWLVKKTAEASPKGEKHGVWSWLFGKKEEAANEEKAETKETPKEEAKKEEAKEPQAKAEPTPAPAPEEAAPEEETAKPAETRQGNVEVTEAVHVPLSNGNGTVEEAQTVGIKELGGGKSGHPYWLIIPGFMDDESALRLWKRVRTTVPQKAAGLNVRVIPPLAHSHLRTSLDIGPFAGRSDAEAFCADAIKQVDSKLQCHFDNKESVSVAANPAPTFDPSKPSKRFWAQIIAAPTQAEALEQWQELKTTNADLLKDMRSSVSPSQTRKNIYVVRLGPLADNNAALNLCGNLQERGINCSVMVFSGL